MRKTMYQAHVVKMRMYQYDDRYMQDFADGSYEDFEAFETHEEAVAWVKATHELMVTNREDYEVTRTRRGLDHIEYHDYGIIPYEVVDGEVEFDYDHDEVIFTMPDELRDAINESERSYHRFLDHEQDHYVGVADILEKEDGDDEE